MSPRQADPQVRAALVETAARLLAEGGPDLLTLRRLTQEVGTSTMAVYTHFGSMDDLRAEVAREGFDRLRRRLHDVAPSEDPVADLARLGSAYLVNAGEDASLYHAIFGLGAAGPGTVAVAGVGYDTFLVLVAGVERCIAAGRFHPADPVLLATQLWAAMHGAVALAHAGLLDGDQLHQAATASARNLFVGFGDDPERVAASFELAGRGTV
jgi:AcrR family transcriptional regulator